MKVEEFKDFHRAVHGTEPFLWQQRLLEQVAEERRWPDVLDLPTGSGKTTCLDIALFALALDAGAAPEKLWCPRRIAMVVDRRIVVDQVALRGRKLLKAMTAKDAPKVVAETADRLRGLSRAKEEPLAVFTLRGGVPKDDGWARTPDQPTILASTVDQIGSRLLIQGYGVSRSMKPVHAGLLANDLLLFLDEVHLSRPFAETLEALERLRLRFASSSPLPRRSATVQLSATPGASSRKVFRLGEAEASKDPVLAIRLAAPKPCRIEDVKDREELEKKCGVEAEKFLERHDVVGVVVNRVESAARISKALNEAVGSQCDIVLLTGRMRPLDRDDVLRAVLPRIEAGRERKPSERKLILVSTQCIEAGADLDLDALVSESASLDALRQRFGRVDRLGNYGNSEGALFHDRSVTEDPIYGESAAKTVLWIREHLKGKKINFGVRALPPVTENGAQELEAPKPRAPVLMPAYLDLWMQTSPPPSRVPEVSLWLHGPDRAPADVQVIWRADLSEEDLERGFTSGADDLVETIGAIRPSSLEALPLSIGAVSRWLAGEVQTSMSDVEGAASERESKEPSQGKAALRWDGRESRVVRVKDVRPGDTLVVPSIRGGIRKGTFDASSRDPVSDLAEKAALLSRGRPVLRLRPEILPGLDLQGLDAMEPEEARSRLGELADSETEGWRRLWLQCLGKGKITGIADRWALIEGPRMVPRDLRSALGPDSTLEHGADLTTDEDDSFHAGKAVTLQVHSADVENFAREYAQALGLPRPLVEDLALAGWLHDIGKADRRFQVLLRGGSEIEYLKDETPLAKSGMTKGARTEHERARRQSGYPEGARHEVQSLALLEKHLDFIRKKAADPQLVLYLVSSHHGWCRPFAPVVEDTVPIDIELKAHASDGFGKVDFTPVSSAHQLHRLDSSLADRFWGLVQKYGWQELCWLEAILRLADHRASEERE